MELLNVSQIKMLELLSKYEPMSPILEGTMVAAMDLGIYLPEGWVQNEK